MSVAERRGRWQGGGAADSAVVRQGEPNAGSGILIKPLQDHQAGLHQTIRRDTHPWRLRRDTFPPICHGSIIRRRRPREFTYKRFTGK